MGILFGKEEPVQEPEIELELDLTKVRNPGTRNQLMQLNGGNIKRTMSRTELEASVAAISKTVAQYDYMVMTDVVEEYHENGVLKCRRTRMVIKKRALRDIILDKIWPPN